jgi:hypothetical protein
VLNTRPSGGAGFGSRASPVTSLAEGGTMCWISFGAHGAAGSGRVGWLIGERGGQARSRGDE